MKRCVRIVIVGVLTAMASAAEADEAPPSSLFFTEDEVQSVETLEAKAALSSAANGDVHLGAVFYYGPDDWVLWLQGEKWTPATQHADLRVNEVRPDEVRLSLVPAPGIAAREMTLKPYQTFQLSTGRVVEGSPAAAASVSRLSR